MTPEDFNYFQSRVTRFISGSNSGIKFGSSVTPRYTRLSSIIPRRAVPQQVLEKIQNKTTSDVDDNIDTSPRGVSALGRVTLNLEQTKNNLEKIFQIIADDYKSTKEQNRKEIDDYRKRVANRGRVFGKRELGDKKSDILGTVKKYVGSFFSGTGGAIRALAMFNLLQGLLSGDPSKIIGPLLGIGLTYIPSIIGNVIGGVVGGVGTALAGRMFGGGARAAGSAAEAGAGASKLGKLGKFGGKAALIGGGLALASGLFNKPQEEDQQQQRLQQLTEQQKGSVGPQSLVPIPQDELKRFDNLNKRFEEALDFLLKKQREGRTTQQQRSGSGGGGGGGTGNPASLSLVSGDAPVEMKSLMDMIASPESGGNYEAMYPSTTLPGATDMTIAQVARRATGPVGRYQHKPEYLEERARAVGLDPNKDKFTPENQDKITRGHIVSVLGGDESKVIEELKRNPSAVKARLETSTYTGLQKYGDNFNTLMRQRMGQYGSSPVTRPPVARGVTPLSTTPNVTVVPVPISSGQQQQTSAASSGNSIVPPIDTTYPENFLALYSKLIYQIV